MGSSSNSRRMRCIAESFSIPISRIAVVTGVSRSLVSRILSPNDPLEGGHRFWGLVEKSLGKILDERQAQVFEVDPIPADELETALREEPK